MTDCITEKRVGEFIVRVTYDEHPDNPREIGSFSKMVCFHKRYRIGDEHDYRSENYEGWIDLKDGIMESEDVHTILPVYMYDHSGITISTSPFSCRFDSGQVGWIYMTKKMAKKYGFADEKVTDYLISEVEAYDRYLRGAYYAFRIEHITTCDLGHEHIEVVESCGNFTDEDECLNEGIKFAENLIQP